MYKIQILIPTLGILLCLFSVENLGEKLKDKTYYIKKFLLGFL